MRKAKKKTPPKVSSPSIIGKKPNRYILYKLAKGMSELSKVKKELKIIPSQSIRVKTISEKGSGTYAVYAKIKELKSKPKKNPSTVTSSATIEQQAVKMALQGKSVNEIADKLAKDHNISKRYGEYFANRAMKIIRGKIKFLSSGTIKIIKEFKRK